MTAKCGHWVPTPGCCAMEDVVKTRAERRRETAMMTKCACGNVAQLGKTECSRCQQESEARVAAQHRFEKFYDEKRRLCAEVARITDSDELAALRDAVLWLMDNAEMKS